MKLVANESSFSNHVIARLETLISRNYLVHCTNCKDVAKHELRMEKADNYHNQFRYFRGYRSIQGKVERTVTATAIG